MLEPALAEPGQDHGIVNIVVVCEVELGKRPD